MLNQKPAFQMTKVDMLLRSPKGVCFLLTEFNNLFHFWLMTDKQNKKALMSVSDIQETTGMACKCFVWSLLPKPMQLSNAKSNVGSHRRHPVAL